MAINLENTLTPPGHDHWLGTDNLGRDLLSRVIYGGRNTLLVGFAAASVSVIIGAFLGVLGGGMQGFSNQIVSAILDSLLAIPGYLIGLIVFSILGQGIWPLILATGLTSVANYGQYARTLTISSKQEEFVFASCSLGATSHHLLLNHIFPSILPSLLGYAGVIFGYSIITATTFSFLGLGGGPGWPEWGAILSDGRHFLKQAPWISLVPAGLIIILVMTVNEITNKLSRVR